MRQLAQVCHIAHLCAVCSGAEAHFVPLLAEFDHNFEEWRREQKIDQELVSASLLIFSCVSFTLLCAVEWIIGTLVDALELKEAIWFLGHLEL